MAKETVYNNTIVSGAADETLTYTRYVKDESSGKSTKELLDEKVNKTDQLGTTQIADKAVTTEKLENESVTTDKLDAASVTTDKVADANITTSKLADSSVETEKINNKAVTTDKLNDGAVDNSKLSPNAVTSEKIKNESIITEKLNDRAVTTEKVEEKAITNEKIGDSAVDGRTITEASVEKKHLANDSVATEKLQDSSVTSDKIHTDAVTEEKIKDSSVSNSKLADSSVGTSKIKDGNITNEKVANNTLTLDKLDPELRKSIQAATGLPENLVETIQDVDKEVKTLHSKDTDLQSQITDKQQQISAHDKDIELLQTRSTQMEQTINNIAATGGASVANTVAYTNTTSGLESVNAQGAIDELAAKNKSQDATISAKAEKSDVQTAVSELKEKDSDLSAEIAKKANDSDVTSKFTEESERVNGELAKKANAEDVSSQMQKEQERVNTEFAKKFDKESILQGLGDAEDKVMSQKAVSAKLSDLSSNLVLTNVNLEEVSTNQNLYNDAKPVVLVPAFQNYYIDRKGKFVSYNGYVVYKPIELKEGEFINVECYANDVSVMSISDTDSITLDSTLTPIVYDLNNKHRSYTYRAKKDCYIVISCRSINNYAQISTYGAKKTLRDAYSELLEKSNKANRGLSIVNSCLNLYEGSSIVKLEKLIQNHYVDMSGNIVPYENYDIYKPIQLLKGKAINIECFAASIATISLSETDSITEGSKLKVVANSSSSYYRQSFTYKATEDCFVVICGRNQGVFAQTFLADDSCITLRAVYDDLNNRVTNIGGSMYLADSLPYIQGGKLHLGSQFCLCGVYFNGTDTIVPLKSHLEPNTSSWRKMVFNPTKKRFDDLNYNEAVPNGYVTLGNYVVKFGSAEFTDTLTNFDFNFIVKSLDADGNVINPTNAELKKMIGKGNDVNSIFYWNKAELYDNIMLQATRYLLTSTGKYDSKPLVLCHFSDIHGDGINLKRILEFYNNYKAYFTDIIHTGDIVYDNFNDGFEFWKNTEGSNIILNCIGNHDSSRKEEDNYIQDITSKQCFDKFFKGQIENWNCVQPESAEDLGLCYYYKDYSDSKIRLVVLDCMHYTDNQNSWFSQVLTEAKDKNYSVLVANHYQGGTLKCDESCTFQSPLWVHADAMINEKASATVDSFMNAGGEFIAWICGHTHRDLFGVLEKYPEQTCIAIDCGFCNDYWNDSFRRSGTKSQDCFNIMSINQSLNTFSIYRVGNNIDLQLRSKKCLVYNYATHKVISNY